MCKKSGSISGMNENHLFGLKYLNSLMRIRDRNNSDPGWKKVASGFRDKHPATRKVVHGLIMDSFLIQCCGPDPHSFDCPGPGSVLGMHAYPDPEAVEIGNDPDLPVIWFPAFLKGFLHLRFFTFYLL
jgi:hypothetical protein